MPGEALVWAAVHPRALSSTAGSKGWTESPCEHHAHAALIYLVCSRHLWLIPLQGGALHQVMRLRRWPEAREGRRTCGPPRCRHPSLNHVVHPGAHALSQVRRAAHTHRARRSAAGWRAHQFTSVVSVTLRRCRASKSAASASLMALPWRRRPCAAVSPATMLRRPTRICGTGALSSGQACQAVGHAGRCAHLVQQQLLPAGESAEHELPVEGPAHSSRSVVQLADIAVGSNQGTDPARAAGRAGERHAPVCLCQARALAGRDVRQQHQEGLCHRPLQRGLQEQQGCGRPDQPRRLPVHVCAARCVKPSRTRLCGCRCLHCQGCAPMVAPPDRSKPAEATQLLWGLAAGPCAQGRHLPAGCGLLGDLGGSSSVHLQHRGCRLPAAGSRLALGMEAGQGHAA